MRDNGGRWHGAQLSLIIAGHWQYYRAKVATCGSVDRVCCEPMCCLVQRGMHWRIEAYLCNMCCTAALHGAAHICKDGSQASPVSQRAAIPHLQIPNKPVTESSPQVLKYLRQIAVITPYAQFRFQYTAQDERNSVAVTFARRTLKMPVPPAVRTLRAKYLACFPDSTVTAVESCSRHNAHRKHEHMRHPRRFSHTMRLHTSSLAWPQVHLEGQVDRALAWHPCPTSAVQAVKHHPASVDLELVKRLIVTTKASNLQKFLATEFTSISRDLAGVVLDGVVRVET